MDREDEKIPRLRFKGYKNTWKQCEVKDICTIATGKSNTQDQVEDGAYPFYIRSDTPVRSNRYLYDCEAVITIGDGNIGKVFHYVNGKFDLHQRCYKMTDFKDIYGKYFYHYFSDKFYTRAIRMTAKTSVDSVRLDMIADMKIYKPIDVDEQKEIACILDEIDNLIALHQRKYEKLLEVKKSLLEKMFPTESDSMPKIRFKGYSDTWGHCKLNTIASLITKGTTPLDKTNLGTINYVKIENIDEFSGKIHITQKITKAEHEGYLRRSQLKENDILFSIAGTLGRVASVDSTILPANTNQALAIIRLQDGDLSFIKTYLNTIIEIYVHMSSNQAEPLAV